MYRTKLMPNHMLLIALPVAIAIVGGLLFSGDFNSFVKVSGRLFSQAQLHLTISLLCGILLFVWRQLPRQVFWGTIIISPIILAVLLTMHLGGKHSITLFYLLSLILTLGLWGILWLCFSSPYIKKVRTVVFALLSSTLLTLCFRGLFYIFKWQFDKSLWTAYFWIALYLFIFIGFGLSLADMLIVMKETEQAKALQRKVDLENDAEDD